jgi:hypothetical protein
MYSISRVEPPVEGGEIEREGERWAVFQADWPNGSRDGGKIG